MTATVTVIGVDGRNLPPGAAARLADVRLVVGPRALLDGLAMAGRGVDAPGGPRLIDSAGAELTTEALDAIASAVTAGAPAVVLTSGDPGFFGILRQLRDRGHPTASWPSVSCVQRIAGMMARPWDDVSVVSARGRDFGAAVNVCRARRAVAVVTAPGAGPAELATALDGWRRQLAVLEDYGGPGEKLSIVDISEAVQREWTEPNVVLCLADGDAGGRDRWLAGGEIVPPVEGWALGEDRFAHREGIGSAAEVRALALAKLAPRPGILLWDVFAGSGALGIEAARLGAAVLAVESDQGLCVRIVANASAYGVDVRLVEGELPAVLAGLPRPDSIFVGAGRSDVVRRCAGVGACRIVVLVRELETLGPARDALADSGYTVDGCQLSAAPLEGLAAGGAAVGQTRSTFLLWGRQDQ